MRPGLDAVIAEIVGVGDDLARHFLRRNDAILDAFPLCIGFRLLLAFKGQPHLLAHVRRGCVTQDRVDPPRRFLVEFQDPEVSLGLAGLHGGL